LNSPGFFFFIYFVDLKRVKEKAMRGCRPFQELLVTLTILVVIGTACPVEVGGAREGSRLGPVNSQIKDENKTTIAPSDRLEAGKKWRRKRLTRLAHVTPPFTESTSIPI